MEKNNGQILIGILTGVAIGVGLGILYAPNKGKKTRKKIKHAVADTSQDVSDWLEQVKDELAQTTHENKKVFDKKIEDSISNMSNKAENIISDMEYKLETLKKKNV